MRTRVGIVLIGLSACASAGIDESSVGPHPDAAVTPPPPGSDAAPPPGSDAAPPRPDAACTQQAVELLANPGFDGSTGSGTAVDASPWLESPSSLVWQSTALQQVSLAPQGGDFAVYLAGYSNADDALAQTVAVPAGALSLRVRGQRHVTTFDPSTTPDDTLEVAITDATGATVNEVLAVWSNRDTTATWTAFDVPLSRAYAGQSVRLRFHARTDGDGATRFFLDTLSLEAQVRVCP